MSAVDAVEWRMRLVRDLVYERVRLHVDLLSLIEFEQELGDRIERALQAGDGPGSDADAMSRRLIDDAWRRLEAEWRGRRDAECPLCAAPFECPAPVS